ncbi:MAG: flagellar biosynthetic protein FliR [Planctomycetota bacterium]
MFVPSWPLLLVTLVRMAGVVILLPTGSTAFSALRFRLALSLVLTMLVSSGISGDVPLDVRFPLVLLQELALGACFGFGIRVLFTAAQVVAELLLHSSGLAQVAWQQAMDGVSTTGIRRFLEITLIAVFFASGGHRALIGNLLQTIVDIPPASFDLQSTGPSLMLGFLARSFELGVYTAFPLLLSAGLGLLATGLLHRLVPQLASLVASAGVGYVILLVTLVLGMGAISGMFESGLLAYADQFRLEAITGR